MNRTLLIILAIIVALGVTFMVIINQPQFGASPKGERLERIKNSPNYKNGAFKNLSETPVLTSNSNIFSIMFESSTSKPKNITPQDSIHPIKIDLKQLSKDKDVLIWFGHSSYFIQLQGKSFLIDPVFSGYAAPFSFMNKAFDGTNTYQSEDMPEIDYLIISHDHYDHLDYETVLKLRPKVKNVVAGLGTGQYFEHWGFEPSSITELDWYEGIDAGNDIRLTATPARHYSGRSIKRNQTLWASYALQSPNYNLYIGGDSGYDPFFKDIGNQFGPFDLAILDQGQYNQNWNLIHLLPDQVFQAAEDLKASHIFPVHNSKFALSSHPWDEPLNKITDAAHKIPAITPRIGEVVVLSDTTQVFGKWWDEINN